MIVSLVAFSIPAFCNRYTCITATGGTTAVNNGAPVSYGGGTGSTARTGSGTGNPVFSPPMNFTPTSVNCGGQTTFTFQLQTLAAEDSPATAILVVYSSVSVTEKNRPSSQHNVDNGYHDPETVTIDGSGNKTFTSSGSHASIIQTPGMTSTQQLTPTASISGTGGAGCSAQVSVKMQLFAVNVVPTNAVVDTDGSQNILIGMGTAPFLQCGVAGSEPGECPSLSLDHFDWSGISGSIFNKYDVHRDNAQVIPYPAGYFVKDAMPVEPWPVVHWSEAENGSSVSETITGTAQCKVFGQSIGTITGTTHIKVWCPYYGFAGKVGSSISDGVQMYAGGLWMNPNTFAISTNPFDGAEPADVGVIWKARVIPEDLFNVGLIGSGFWQLAQTIAPNIWKTQQDGIWHSVNNGQLGLDNAYPYAPYANIEEQDIPRLATWGDNDSPHVASDRPASPFANTTHKQVSHSFKTYTVYCPGTFDPNLQSEIVPLHKYEWAWWSDYSNNGNGWFGGGAVTSFDDLRFKTHPTWGQALFATHPLPWWLPGQ